MMESMDGLLELLITIVAVPLVLFKQVFFEIGNFFVFDVFQLGPFLPITL